MLSAKGFAGVRVNSSCQSAKAKTTGATLSIPVSLADEEIELVVSYSIAQVHLTVEKKEPSHSPLPACGAIPVRDLDIPISSEVLAVIAANTYKLLFPFHHFW